MPENISLILIVGLAVANFGMVMRIGKLNTRLNKLENSNAD